MTHVCRRRLTAFSSQPVVTDQVERCINQQPANITFSSNDHLKMEDYHMKIPHPFRVYADFECKNQPQNNPNKPNILFKQIPIAVGHFLISPIGIKYYFHSRTDCVKWFVTEMCNLEKLSSDFFKSNIPISRSKDPLGFVMSPEEEEQIEESTTCWLCQEPFDADTAELVLHRQSISGTSKVRNHDHQVNTEEQPTVGVI